MPTSRIDDDQVCSSTCSKTIANNGRSIFLFRFTIDHNGRIFEQLRQLSICTRTMNVSLDNCYTETVLLSIPLSQLCRRCCLSLTIESNQEQCCSAWLELMIATKETNQLKIEDVHCMCLKIEPRAWLFFPHPFFQPINDFFGLSNVKICLLKCSTKTLCHFFELFLVQTALAS